MDAGDLVERDRELSALRDAVLAARRGAGRAMLVGATEFALTRANP